MITWNIAFAVMLATILLGSQSAIAQLPTGQSPIERSYIGIKMLDAYFGTSEEKMEIDPGDLHVPFTVVFTNVGNSDIVGLTGTLMMPLNFLSPGSGTTMIKADAEASVPAGQSFSMTFYVDVSEHSKISTYKGTVKTDYSRLRETGQRSDLHIFNFELVGRSIIDVSAADPFVRSFEYNDIIIDVFNSGSAAASGVKINLNTPTINDESSESEVIIIFDSSWNIGNIKANESKNITTSIYVPGNLADKAIRLPMTIEYFNAQGNVQTVERTADIYVRGLVDLHVYGIKVIDLSDKQTIIGNILNEGNEEALFTFVTIKPLKGSNIKATTQFIDNIDMDSPVPFNIPVEFDGIPQYGQQDIKIEIRYKDGIRDEIIKTHNTTILIPKPVTENGTDISAVLGALLAGIAAVASIIFVIKRKKQSQVR